mmetsp:Transcript_60659/g.192544  ORF Transcript_60659/g.192544 Transcript_60659/m.192544 type:complete len:344 (+) Transcript_60659:240-1271(+)
MVLLVVVEGDGQVVAAPQPDHVRLAVRVGEPCRPRGVPRPPLVHALGVEDLPRPRPEEHVEGAVPQLHHAVLDEPGEGVRHLPEHDPPCALIGGHQRARGPFHHGHVGAFALLRAAGIAGGLPPEGEQPRPIAQHSRLISKDLGDPSVVVLAEDKARGRPPLPRHGAGGLDVAAGHPPRRHLSRGGPDAVAALAVEEAQSPARLRVENGAPQCPRRGHRHHAGRGPALALEVLGEGEPDVLVLRALDHLRRLPGRHHRPVGQPLHHGHVHVLEARRRLAGARHIRLPAQRGVAGEGRGHLVHPIGVGVPRKVALHLDVAAVALPVAEALLPLLPKPAHDTLAL